MNELLIQSLSIDWNRIEQHSYLRKIEAIKNLEELVFEKNIAFLFKVYHFDIFVMAAEVY